MVGGKCVRMDRHRFTDYTQSIIPKYSVFEFQSHFRLSSSVVEQLIGCIGNWQVVPRETPRGKHPISEEKHILVTLWFLSTREKYTSVADRFGICESSVYVVLMRVLSAFADRANEFIKWSTGPEQAISEACFRQRCKIPGIIAAIDGTHMPIVRPQKYEDEYINRKGFHSVNVQIVAKHDKIITSVFGPFPGGVHDARMLRRSDLFEKAENGQLVHDQFHLLGDSAYPLRPWLIVPYKDNGHLTRQQKDFNYQLSKGRIIVEHTIGLLKGRFPRLKLIEMKDTKNIRCVIITALLCTIFVLEMIQKKVTWKIIFRGWMKMMMVM